VPGALVIYPRFINTINKSFNIVTDHFQYQMEFVDTENITR